MSKTVIVFSTYYNSPIFEDKLFNMESSEPILMNGEKLCGFLWNRLITDKYNGESTLKKIWNDYLTEDAKHELNQEIIFRYNKVKDDAKRRLDEYIKQNEELLKKDYTEIFDYEDLDYLNGEKEEKYPELADIFYGYKDPDRNAIVIEALKEKRGAWISKYLRKEGQQDLYDIKLPQGVIESSPELADKPLLSYRYTYYRLKDSNKDVKVYAIWPLGSPASDAGKNWIDALTEQFGKDTDRLYLILHDKDIKDKAFEIFLCDHYENTERFVVLYQHTTKHIGNFISRYHPVKEIEGYLDDHIRNYHYLGETSRFLEFLDFDNLRKCCGYLPPKYNDIKKNIDNLAKDPDNEMIFSMIEKLICREREIVRP